MRKTTILLGVFLLLGGSFGSIAAQTAATPTPTAATAKYDLATGEISSMSGDRIVIKTKDGAAIEAVLSDKTEYKRLAAVNPSMKTATPATLTDIGVGDKIAVVGMLSADKKSVPAVKVFLMSKSDIAQKQAKDREEWRARGITGQVAAINPQTKEITVSVRGGFGVDKKTVLTMKDGAMFLHYAPDSVDYNEAIASSFDEVKVGDVVRALGDKSEDGATLKAEKILTGSFQTVGGTITAINAERGEITITNIQTKKPVTIAIGKTSILKNFPAEAAQRMAQFQMMQAGGAMPGGAQGGGMVRPPRPAGETGGNAQQPQGDGQNPNRAGGGRGFGGGMRAGVGGNIDEMLDRFPTISISDLKVGDMIAVSSTKGANSDRINAIKLLSGVEPFLKAAQQNAGAGRRNGGGQDTGFQIPGLENGGSNFP